MKNVIILCALIIIGCSDKRKVNSSEKLSNQDIIALLDTIYRAEQEPLRLRDSLSEIYGKDSEESNAQSEIYKRNHAINETKIKDLLKTYGWPSKDIIGEQGSLTICNVLQHSSPEVRVKYLPMMKEAVLNKKLDAWLLERAQDRIDTDQGNLQMYGTQIKYYPKTKKLNVWPIYDPENVDKRRAEIGLPPIAEYLKNRFNLEWNLEEQIKRSEEFEKKRNTE